MHLLTNDNHLQQLYEREGPFVSLFMPHGDAAPEAHAAVRFARLRDRAAAEGATSLALDAIDARLSLPVYGEVGGRAVIAAADGTTVVDCAPEGPAADALFVDALPYAAPLLEWQQWRVPHVAALVGAEVIEEATFVPGCEPELRPIGATAAEAALELAHTARSKSIELLLVAGTGQKAHDLMERLVGIVPAQAEVMPLDTVEGEDLASAVVRAVADKVARKTVMLLREFRFLSAHASAVEGVEATLDVLRQGSGDVLLVHDDPADRRRAWFGSGARELASEQSGSCRTEGRLVDVVIRAALLQGMAVRVIPATGPRGPDGDIGVLLRDPTRQLSAAAGRDATQGGSAAVLSDDSSAAASHEAGRPGPEITLVGAPGLARRTAG